jgi:hypothetical protein
MVDRILQYRRKARRAVQRAFQLSWLTSSVAASNRGIKAEQFSDCAFKYLSPLPLSRLRRRIEPTPRHGKSGAMMSRYRLKTPIPAIYERGRGLVRVTLPAGAVLTESSQPSETLIGMIGVYCEGRHYSVHLRDLLKNGERVSVA